MAIFPTVISFLFSYKCNFRCAHCSVNAGPWHSEVMSFDTMRKAVREASEIASVQVAVATGGEPTLFPRHLETFIKMSYDHGFTTRIVTNAWWASTLQRAENILQKWSKLGLAELSISVDDFHLEYLHRFGGLNNIKNAVVVALNNNIRVAIAISRHKNTEFTSSYLKQYLGDLINQVYILEDFIAPVGRASSLIEYAVVNLPQHGGCAEAGSTLSIHPNGDVSFCCGHIINDESSSWFTRVGNINEHPLWEIVDRIRRNALIIFIRYAGPHNLVKYLNPNEKVYHMCHACHLLATKYWHDLMKLGKDGLISVAYGILDYKK